MGSTSKEYLAKENAPGIHIVFIEEPEVHLHPQMQEVFISNLNRIAQAFTDHIKRDVKWPVQFVVTTHSSHVANKAPFESMRYFHSTSDEHSPDLRTTIIKDLRTGLAGTPGENLEFLHKYMTLTCCDLLFADKAILIEGAAERILLPKMIEMTDVAEREDSRLSSQYVSVLEVGGAYAHLFFGLLEFLDLRSLIITDIDSTKKNDDNYYVACKVSEGTHTSNACIKDWFKKNVDNQDCDGGKGSVHEYISTEALLRKSAYDKIQGIRRIAYQVPEEEMAPCGRSFEDAFVLANPVLFDLSGLSKTEKEEAAWKIASALKSKTDFALEFALVKTSWNVPLYIKDGLSWLAEGIRSNPPLSATSGLKPSIRSC